MAITSNPLDDPADAAALARYAAALLGAVDGALPPWVERMTAGRWRAWSGDAPSEALAMAARRAGEEARAEAIPALRVLLQTDVDEQRTNPLSVLRRAARHATAVLAMAGVPSVVRDEQAERLLPDDPYDLGPAAFADLGPSVQETGLAWGAAKAHVILTRRRSCA